MKYSPSILSFWLFECPLGNESHTFAVDEYAIFSGICLRILIIRLFLYFLFFFYKCVVCYIYNIILKFACDFIYDVLKELSGDLFTFWRKCAKFNN